MVKIIKSHTTWLLVVLFLILSFYGYIDVSTSKQGSGEAGADRTLVHISVITLILIEFIYNLFSHTAFRDVNYLTQPLYFYGGWLVVSGIFNGVSPINIFFYLLFIIWWITTAKFFSVYTYRNSPRAKSVIYFFVLLFCVWIVLNFKARLAISSLLDRYGITMFVYYILLLFPIILFIKKKKIRYGLIGLGIITTILSLKRGAIITLPMMLLVFYFVKAKLNKRTSRFFVWALVLSILLIILLFIIDNYTGGLLLSRFDSASLESGSGRDELRQDALGNISRRGVFEFLFGLGPGSTVEYLGTGAHNEWIESLFSLGLIGVSIYFWIVFRCYRLVLRYYKKKSNLTPFLAMYLTYLVLCTLFSGFIFMHVAFYFWSGMGLLIGLNASKVNISY